jgi:hypothetical protein
MTMYHLNIFGKMGLPRLDIPESEIAKLSKEQSAAFFSVISTYSDTNEADNSAIASEKAKRAAISDLKRRMVAHETIIPPRTFYDEWKRTVAKMPEPEISADTKKKLAASLKGIERAHAYLAECESAEVVAKQVRKEKRQAFAVALMAWARVDGSPKTTADLVRARAKTEAAQQLANIAAGLDPNHAAHLQATVGDSHLDRFKAGQGGGHSVNQGYGRNKMRGATVKVPSER